MARLIVSGSVLLPMGPPGNFDPVATCRQIMRFELNAFHHAIWFSFR
jgi:hypothetical protein